MKTSFLMRIMILCFYVINLPVYYFSLIVPRKRDLWIFGARQGSAFGESAKYLFLHMNREHPEIRSVWLTRKRSVIREIRGLGLEAYHTHSPRGYWYTMRAAAAFFTSLNFLPSDLNIYGWNRRLLRIDLHHGSPVKKIIHDNPSANFSKRSLRDRALRAVFPFYGFLYGPDFTRAVAASPAVKETLMTAFNCGEEKVIVTGYPTCDFLMDNRKTVPGERAARVIYLPTWRVGSFDIFSGYGFDFSALETFCAENNVHFHIKLHHYAAPLDADIMRKITGSQRVDCIIIDDIYDVLYTYDVLITDYSSVIFDFLVLDRPVILANFDIAENIKVESGFYYDPAEISPGSRATDWNELLRAIEESIKNSGQYERERLKVRKKFYSFNDSGSSRRIYDKVIGLLDEKRE